MKKTFLFLVACFACLMMQAQQLHWTPVDQGLYSGSTTVVAYVQIDGVEQTTDQIELGVFCGDECRGTAMVGEAILPIPIPLPHSYLAQVNVYGENGHTLTFKAYDHRTNQELAMDPEVTVTFTEDGAGTIMAPLELNFTVSVTQNTTSGDWSDPTTWGGTVPTPEAIVELGADVTIGDGTPATVTVAGLTIDDGVTLTIEEGSTLIVTGDLVNDSQDGLIISDGAQLINASANVAAVMEKNIAAYSKGNLGWYVIGSPMDEMLIESSAFTVPEFDLYRYNETSIGEEWENYKNSGNAGFTVFENGRGYLFANSNSYTAAFVGTLNNADVSYNVTYTDRTDGLSGFNLIGNPFPHAIYKGVGGAIDNANLASGYYTLNNEGAWHVHTYEDAIMPGQGILVKTTATMNLGIAKSTAVASAETGGAKAVASRLGVTITGDNGEDRAFVYFGQGVGLEKMAGFSQQTPSLWVRNNGTDYAIAHVDPEGESIDLFFHNQMNGDYRLSFVVKDITFSFLQLVDNYTGAVVDLKQQPDYSFHATGNEADGRFKIYYRLTTGVDEMTDETPFAYVMNGKIVLVGVSEDADLHVFDMTGRLVPEEGLIPGVYVLRLLNGKEVKTQKIVVK